MSLAVQARKNWSGETGTGCFYGVVCIYKWAGYVTSCSSAPYITDFVMATATDQEPKAKDPLPAAKKPRVEFEPRPIAADDDPTARSCAWLNNTTRLQRYAKPSLGLNVDYYPQFFSKRDADSLFKRLESELQPYFESSLSQVVKIMGKIHQIPRKRTAFGDSGLSYSFSGITVTANTWTPFMTQIKNCVEGALQETFNFVLVNRYKDGLDHIGEHRDDEKDLCRGAPIASISLGQERDFVLKHKDSRGREAPRKDIQPVKVSLRHGSLLVMRDPTNSQWYHSLPVRKNAAAPRINLTFRRMVLHTTGSK